jgi:predicted DNA-binding protein (UPF0278 family)
MSEKIPNHENTDLPVFMQTALRNTLRELVGAGCEVRLSLPREGLAVTLNINSSDVSVDEIDNIISNLPQQDVTYTYDAETGKLIISPRPNKVN